LIKQKIFINASEPPKDQKDKVKPIMFTITSRSGRCLEDLSFYPDEKEVAFRPFTTFNVIHVEVKELEGVGQTYFIELKEAHPDIRGRKVLIWIDDTFSTESKLIMDHCERENVTFVNLHSTKEAQHFFRGQGQVLLNRDIPKMRIITDMVRTEDGTKNIEAGIQVTKLLKEEFKYVKPVLCYTGSFYLKSNREKFIKEKLTNVFVTDEQVDAVIWGKFQGVPTGIEQLKSD